jgi:low molecular weight protein-tyrosine phosphatase
MTSKRILFLCTGNYYRSRFAEILFNWHAELRGLAWKAESRGLALDLFNLGPMSGFTETRLQSRGISFDAYQRLPLDVTLEDFATADHVVAVKEAEHRPLIQRRFPEWLERVEFWQVHDIDFARPDEALPHLERHVDELVERFMGVK